MIPNYQRIMLPLLKSISDGRVHKFSDLVESISNHFGLTDEEKNELLPSGKQGVIDNRVGWSRFYLIKAGLIRAERRGYIQISESGKAFLNSNPSDLNSKLLDQFEDYRRFKGSLDSAKPVGKSELVESEESTDKSTPEDMIEYGYLKLKTDLKRDLLLNIKRSSPRFFETLVVDLLVKMGYGGSRKDAGQAIGKSGDGGIDGIIKEDKLGLDQIYLQAKRWEGTVPVKEIRDFAGSLLQKKARKGVFITTSDFPKSAYEFVGSIDPKIILIDGDQLADLMIESNVGVSLHGTFEIKKLDSDYFESE